MRVATGTGKPPVPYTITADWTDDDGNTHREVHCTERNCDPGTNTVCSSSAWAFGVADQHTHVAMLRIRLSNQCGHDVCPHDEIVKAFAGAKDA